MSESKKRKVHTPEFKAKVGLEAVRGVTTTREVYVSGQGYDICSITDKAVKMLAVALYRPYTLCTVYL